MKMCRIYTGILFCFVFFSSVYAIPSVKVITIKAKQIYSTREYVGHVEAIRTVDIMPRVEGYLQEVRFREGDYVEKGKILYIIEQEPYIAEVEIAEAVLEKAKAHLFKAEQRLKRLCAASPESVSKADIDDAKAEVMLAKAEIKEAKARLKKAKINFNYTIIKAPISGIVGKSFAKEGNLVSPNKGPLCRIVQIDPIRVVYSVSEKEMQQIRLSLKHMLKVKIRLPDGRIFPACGNIDFVDNHVDPETGTIAIWAVFPNSERTLLPGMYVTAISVLKTPKKIITIPQRAVLEDREGYHVLIVNKGNRVEIRRIKIGNMIGTEWEVLSGLSEGDRVIVEGILKLKPGQLVQIKE